jgi:hypothetical protein
MAINTCVIDQNNLPNQPPKKDFSKLDEILEDFKKRADERRISRNERFQQFKYDRTFNSCQN